MSKYKYYFRKPRSEIIKDILSWIAMSGAVYIAASSPYFILNLERGIKKWLREKKYKKKKLYDAFYRLRREGCIEMSKKNQQIYIRLTEKGRRKAGWLQIDRLAIKRPRKWDKKWRIVIFDISQLKKLYREAFRGRLKELGFRPLQKSVWVHPFECRDEIELLRDFFGLSEKELRFIISEDIGRDNWLKKVFKLET